MDYRVDEVSLDDADLERQVESLIANAFSVPIPSGRVRRNTAARGRAPPLYVAALQDDEIIGFNAFIGHRLSIDGDEVLAYQSCWTATSAAHRGKRIFQNLILAAHEILNSRGVGFVFGFPNSESHPIFVKKLGYRQLPSVKWQMPNLAFATKFFLTSRHADLQRLQRGAVLQDDRALIRLKRNEMTADLRQFECEGSLCWGVRRQRQVAGMTISYLDVGGIELADASHLPRILDGLLREVQGAAYAQVVSIEGATYNELLRKVRPSQSNVLIIRDLSLDTARLRFNLFGGVRDVY
jgi:predicted N-acetyltransferase YhbS